MFRQFYVQACLFGVAVFNSFSVRTCSTLIAIRTCCNLLVITCEKQCNTLKSDSATDTFVWQVTAHILSVATQTTRGLWPHVVIRRARTRTLLWYLPYVALPMEQSSPSVSRVFGTFGSDCFVKANNLCFYVLCLYIYIWEINVSHNNIDLHRNRDSRTSRGRWTSIGIHLPRVAHEKTFT